MNVKTEGKRLTPKQNLSLLHNHINNVIQETCGPDADHHRWNVNEIVQMTECVGNLNAYLEHYSKLQDENAELSAKLKELEARIFNEANMNKTPEENKVPSKTKKPRTRKPVST